MLATRPDRSLPFSPLELATEGIEDGPNNRQAALNQENDLIAAARSMLGEMNHGRRR